MVYIFLDESGQFSRKRDGEYFVIASFIVGNQNRTAKAIRSWFGSKFPRKMRNQAEIKWSASGIDDDLRVRTLQHIAKLDVRIRYGYLLRKNIPAKFRRKGRIESGAFYTNVVGEVLEGYFPTNEKEIYIFCDYRSLKGSTKKEFQSAILARLFPFCAPATRIQVEMIDSTTNANIQIADWIAGALVKYLEEGHQGAEYYKILKNNFLDSGIEFFKE